MSTAFAATTYQSPLHQPAAALADAAPHPPIAVETISITRAEGLSSMCRTSSHLTFASASERLREICASAPRDGGYHKVDFLIRYVDGTAYGGRYDAVASADSNADLSAFMRARLCARGDRAGQAFLRTYATQDRTVLPPNWSTRFTGNTHVQLR